MRAKLTFDLNEELESFRDAVDATNLRIVLQSMDNYLRGRIKYENLEDGVLEALEAARSELHRIAEEYGVSVWA